MAFFRRELEDEIAYFRRKLADPEYVVPQNWRWWDDREKKLEHIEEVDLGIIRLLRLFHNDFGQNESLSRHVIDQCRKLNELLDRMISHPNVPYSDMSREAQIVARLKEDINQLLERAAHVIVQPRAGSSDAKFVQCANNMIETGKKVIRNQVSSDNAHSSIKDEIYSLLTQRKTRDEYDKLTKAYDGTQQDLYEQRLREAAIKMKKMIPGSSVDFGGYWFSYFPPNMAERRKSRYGEVYVNFKQYFSFVPTSKNSEEIFMEILRFIDALPGLAGIVYELGRQENDAISFKIPEDLSIFLNHNDSLVIHFYSRQDLGKVIEGMVKNFFKKHEVYFTRKGRAGSGFDFKSDDPSLGASHSQIIAKIVADYFFQQYVMTRRVETVTAPEMVRWLKAIIADVNPLELREAYMRYMNRPGVLAHR
jgi:uncharacterized protein (DUF1778 family)